MEPLIPVIPEEEIEITFSRSSGPGGQNVNKTNTKALASWNIRSSNAFTNEQKEILISTYKKEVLLAYNQQTRSQPENRLRAVRRLNEMVQIALTIEKERVPTKTPLKSKRERLIEKLRRSVIKSFRQKPKKEE